MERDEYLAHLARDGRRIAALARGDLDAPVPTCPGWTLRDLVEHLVGVWGWLHEAGRIDRDGPPAARVAVVPPDGMSHADWVESTLGDVLLTMSALEPDAPRWVWSQPEKATATWYFRRLAHETVVHRLDAELTGDAPTDVDAAFAVDGVDEMCDVFIPLATGQAIGGGGRTLHLHATDAEGEWLLTLHDDRVDVARGHAKGDAAVRGAARDLLLQMWGRDPIGAVEVFGDESVVATFRAAAKI